MSRFYDLSPRQNDGRIGFSKVRVNGNDPTCEKFATFQVVSLEAVREVA